MLIVKIYVFLGIVFGVFGNIVICFLEYFLFLGREFRKSGFVFVCMLEWLYGFMCNIYCGCFNKV